MTTHRNPLSRAGRPTGSAGLGRPPAPHYRTELEDLRMTTVKTFRPRNRFTTLAAQNSALRVECDAMYTLLVELRDWLKIAGADLEKISRIEGRIRAVQRMAL